MNFPSLTRRVSSRGVARYSSGEEKAGLELAGCLVPARIDCNGCRRSKESAIPIFVDADACPVKSEVYRVAERYALKVFVVSNAPIRVPRDPRIEVVVVSDRFDAADDWIAERAGPGDIVVTADIPLADRSLKAGAEVIGNTGVPFTSASIGMAMASRELLSHLRAMGENTGGPKPMSPRDRSRFLSALDEAVQKIRRRSVGGS